MPTGLSGTASVDPGHWDRLAGWLAVSSLVILLLSEGALTLPDETASAGAVARFYAAHRAVIIGLQILGFLAAALLAGFALRLRLLDRLVTATGLILAVAALLPGALTIVLAIRAGHASLDEIGRWNRLEPRTDDLLFLAVTLFAVVVAVRLGRGHRWLTLITTLAAVACGVRLLLEAAGHSRGVLETIAPLLFLALVASLAAMCFRGTLAPRAAAAA